MREFPNEYTASRSSPVFWNTFLLVSCITSSPSESSWDTLSGNFGMTFEVSWNTVLALFLFSSLVSCSNEEITLSFNSYLLLISHITSSKLQFFWDIFSAGIWRPSMLSCKLELKFSLLSTSVCCSIGVITLFVDPVVFFLVHFVPCIFSSNS